MTPAPSADGFLRLHFRSAAAEGARGPARVPALALALALAGGLALAPVPAGATPVEGTLNVLTYNVAGLPLGLSQSRPEVNNALISPLLNFYDLVVVQEDFGFHDDLISRVDHPYLTEKDTSDRPGLHFGIGDGLNRMSRTPFSDFTRVTWEQCFGLLDNGSDCLAPKGFSVARHQLAPGATVDVYNWHADANGDEDSKAARRAEIRQMIAFMDVYSAGQAILLLGDTNSRYTRDGDILPELLAETGLSDIWIELERGGDVPAAGDPALQTCAVNGPHGADCERVDKIFYRSSDRVRLTPLEYWVDEERFTDAAGVDLSDHEPVSGVFAFRALPEPGVWLLALAAAACALAARAGRREPARAPVRTRGRRRRH